MGPLAGLGDSIIVGTFIPILLGIALGLSTGGSVLGPLFYILAWNISMYFGMKFAFDQGYELGGSAVEALVGPQSAALRSSIVMVGTMVIGAVAATWINITTALVVPFSADSSLVLQDTLDSIYPKLLNFLFVWFCWWLMTKRKMSPTVVMGLWSLSPSSAF
jgi:mannose/fructose/N-acetylgalactosamine-specific phosphotransferase system component IID